MVNKPPSGNGVASRLAAFLRPSPSAPATFSKRPKGKLIWLHLSDDVPAGPVHELCQMLSQQFEGTKCLITTNSPEKFRVIENALVTPLPIDHATNLEDFFEHWNPDLLLWADQQFQPRILQVFTQRKRPMFLINLAELDLSRRGSRRIASSILDSFDLAHVTSKSARDTLVGLGLPAVKIVEVAPMSEMARPMPDNENRRRAIAAGLGPRPIWCAAHMRMAELSSISTAHHIARKSFPTALLVLVPADGEDVKEIVRILSTDGWRVVSENTSTTTDRQSEILVANGPADLGIWYRLASVSVMGGSVNGPVSCDPFEAVALGSAVICGPITFPHGDRYRQLEQEGALARVSETSTLGACLTQTLAPDQSASLATAGWAVGSEGVEALLQIVDLVKSALQPEAS